jgi:hypothetical protein
LRLALPDVKTQSFLANFINYLPAAGIASRNMATLLEMGQNLLWTVYETAKAAPLSILLFLLVTTAAATLAFVRPRSTANPL